MKTLNAMILAGALFAGIAAPAVAMAAPMSPASADHGGKASGGGATLAGVKKGHHHSSCRYILSHPGHFRSSTVRACHHHMM